MTRLLLATALLLPASLAWAQAAPPPAPAAQAGAEYEMPCAMFGQNADGSWHVTRPMTLRPASGPIPLKPSQNFRVGTLFEGFDLAAALDSACGH